MDGPERPSSQRQLRKDTGNDMNSAVILAHI